ncbi:hypothetical protein [Chondrinema litorale]|uniref:hypothetical protein n=1 Tax=Chondrinema litorale TaxID=2994555 RepID=UPI0025436586|nr:hypothetical protein [Chondrinema litorale]UZR93140.1 hypothetical protein OQ292_14870 [Chondrinema litorale]
MIHLYHALDQLKVPGQDGKQPEFSIEFVVAQGEKKGQLRFIDKAVVNHFSKGKTIEKLQNPESKSKATYNHKDSGVIAIRVLASQKYPAGQILTPKKLFITKINGLKTFI